MEYNIYIWFTWIYLDLFWRQCHCLWALLSRWETHVGVFPQSTKTYIVIKHFPGLVEQNPPINHSPRCIMFSPEQWNWSCYNSPKELDWCIVLETYTPVQRGYIYILGCNISHKLYLFENLNNPPSTPTVQEASWCSLRNYRLQMFIYYPLVI